MSEHAAQILRGTIVLAFLAAAVGWVVVRSIKKAEDPPRMVFKWILTAIVLVFMFTVAARLAGNLEFSGIALTLVCGLVLAAIWRHSIGALVAMPFVALYDGGSAEPDPKPFYSVARARQKQGRYVEAILEIRKQLERFPNDVEGQMLMAQIEAEDRKDLRGAETTIDHFCAQPGHAPKNIAFALYSMADWHLAIGQDREAAKRYLQKIIDLLPDTESALGAAQRIAHLGTAEMMLAPQDRRKFIVEEGIQNLGLRKKVESFAPAETEPTRQAAEYVRHLEQHPLDTEAREKLAIIYADHYQRLDLAAGQLEQMITQPNLPAKNIVRWLNLLADLQIRCGADLPTVQQTLQRIIDLDPTVAAADLARSRLSRVKLELKANEKSQAVKLGSYEDNIGLKRARNSLGPPGA